MCFLWTSVGPRKSALWPLMRPISSVKEVQNKCRLLRSNRSSKEAHFKCALTVHLPPTWAGHAGWRLHCGVKRPLYALKMSSRQHTPWGPLRSQVTIYMVPKTLQVHPSGFRLQNLIAWLKAVLWRHKVVCMRHNNKITTNCTMLDSHHFLCRLQNSHNQFHNKWIKMQLDIDRESTFRMSNVINILWRSSDFTESVESYKDDLWKELLPSQGSSDRHTDNQT